MASRWRLPRLPGRLFGVNIDTVVTIHGHETRKSAPT
jgi:hypothetical protein